MTEAGVHIVSLIQVIWYNSYKRALVILDIHSQLNSSSFEVIWYRDSSVSLMSTIIETPMKVNTCKKNNLSSLTWDILLLRLTKSITLISCKINVWSKRSFYPRVTRQQFLPWGEVLCADILTGQSCITHVRGIPSIPTKQECYAWVLCFSRIMFPKILQLIISFLSKKEQRQ